jgi:hypothetical protein
MGEAPQDGFHSLDSWHLIADCINGDLFPI